MSVIDECRRQATRVAQRGVAIVEFALVLPIFLLLVFGIINFGLLMYDLSVVTNAAREGARWQAVSTNYAKNIGKTYSATQTVCTLTESPVSNPTNPVVVTCNYLKSVRPINLGTGGFPEIKVDSPDGNRVKVTVIFDFGWFGYIPFISFANKEISATMYYE